jgi:hypothetical protein
MALGWQRMSATQLNNVSVHGLGLTDDFLLHLIKLRPNFKTRVDHPRFLRPVGHGVGHTREKAPTRESLKCKNPVYHGVLSWRVVQGSNLRPMVLERVLRAKCQGKSILFNSRNSCYQRYIP